MGPKCGINTDVVKHLVTETKEHSYLMKSKSNQDWFTQNRLGLLLGFVT